MSNKLFEIAKFIVIPTVLFTLMTACYRMPTDDDYTTIPTTNNPHVTNDKGGFTPNIKY